MFKADTLIYETEQVDNETPRKKNMDGWSKCVCMAHFVQKPSRPGKRITISRCVCSDGTNTCSY